MIINYDEITGLTDTVTSGSGKADCTITISEENFLALVSGKLQGMQAFMSGKMKIKGNMGLAQKFGALTDAVKKAGGAPKPAAATAPRPPERSPNAPVLNFSFANLR